MEKYLWAFPAQPVRVGLYCKAFRAYLRHARTALATAPQCRPKGSLSLTQGFIRFFSNNLTFIRHFKFYVAPVSSKMIFYLIDKIQDDTKINIFPIRLHAFPSTFA